MEHKINWFPGHMAKSIREIETNLPKVDIVIYVLDSRAPYACLNPVFDGLFEGIPKVYALNKADLGSESLVKGWLNILSTPNSAAVAIRGTDVKSVNIIPQLIKKLCIKTLEKYERKGVKKTLRALVAGVPNTGKSSIINSLAPKAKTITGNRPGVTRQGQWVKVNNYLELFDTPGTLYPKLNDSAIRLAYIGSIKDEIIDINAVALELARDLNKIDKEILISRYGAEIGGCDAVESINLIAKKRGYLLKGGEVDSGRAAVTLLDDFRRGRLGRITLERAEDYESIITNR